VFENHRPSTRNAVESLCGRVTADKILVVSGCDQPVSGSQTCGVCSHGTVEMIEGRHDVGAEVECRKSLARERRVVVRVVKPRKDWGSFEIHDRVCINAVEFLVDPDDATVQYS